MTQQGKPMENQLAEVLNRDCYCIAVNKEALHNSLEEHLKDSGLPEQLLNAHNHLFSDSPVFYGRDTSKKWNSLFAP